MPNQLAIKTYESSLHTTQAARGQQCYQALVQL